MAKSQLLFTLKNLFWCLTLGFRPQGIQLIHWNDHLSIISWQIQYDVTKGLQHTLYSLDSTINPIYSVKIIKNYKPLNTEKVDNWTLSATLVWVTAVYLRVWVTAASKQCSKLATAAANQAAAFSLLWCDWQ